MRIAAIRELDISNGEGVGVALFVQGCPFHCKNCFNSDTWDFNGGHEWDDKTKDRFITLIKRPYIDRVSFLGGEPLAEQNVLEVLSLISEIKRDYPNKKIWLYSGFKFEDLNSDQLVVVSKSDVFIDGQFEEDKKDLTLKFRGSSNQRIWAKGDLGWYVLDGGNDTIEK